MAVAAGAVACWSEAVACWPEAVVVCWAVAVVVWVAWVLPWCHREFCSKGRKELFRPTLLQQKQQPQKFTRGLPTIARSDQTP